MVQVHLINPESGEVEFIESYDSLGEAVAETRELWNEEERGEQTFLISEEATGRLLAVMTRPDTSDPELCLTTTFEPGGALVVTSIHRCRYVIGADGYYARTEVTRVLRPGDVDTLAL